MRELLDSVRRTIRRFGLADAGTRVVAAVSGGPDSVGMARLLLALDAAGELQLAGIAHFNHQLRHTAGDDERFCAELAAELQRPFFAGRDDVAQLALDAGVSLETAAHDARYLFFERARLHFRADIVALGHTRDDQAETHLMRIVRGAGLAGLAAMHPQHGAIVRPLIESRRAAVREFLTKNGWPFVHDETNDDVRIARNRFRAELLPVLERFNPSIVDVLADEAEVARENWRWMKTEAAKLDERLAAVDGDTWRIDAGGLNALPVALARLILHEAMTDAAGGRTVPFAHVDAALELSRQTEQRQFDAPGQRVERTAGHLVLRSRPVDLVGRWVEERPLDPANFFSYGLSIPGEVISQEAGWTVSAEEADSADLVPRAVPGNHRTAVVARNRPQGALFVRNRRPGDRFRPEGAGGARKLQDFLVDRKVARRDRDRVPLVVDELDRILWVAGHAVSEEFRVTKATEPVIVLRLK